MISFRPFWAAVEETGALVFIHPTTGGLGISRFERLLHAQFRRQSIGDSGGCCTIGHVWASWKNIQISK